MDYEYYHEPKTVHEQEVDDETPPQVGMHATKNTSQLSTGTGEQSEDTSSDTVQSETSNIFKNMTEKFTNKERCEKPVDKDLADMVNNLFRDAIPDDKYNELVKKIQSTRELCWARFGACESVGMGYHLT